MTTQAESNPRIFVTVSYLFRIRIEEHHGMAWKFHSSPRIQPNPNIYRFLVIRGIPVLCGIGVLVIIRQLRYNEWVLGKHNYNFIPHFLKHCMCFVDGLKMCIGLKYFQLSHFFSTHTLCAGILWAPFFPQFHSNPFDTFQVVCLCFKIGIWFGH